VTPSRITVFREEEKKRRSKENGKQKTGEYGYRRPPPQLPYIYTSLEKKKKEVKKKIWYGRKEKGRSKEYSYG